MSDAIDQKPADRRGAHSYPTLKTPKFQHLGCLVAPRTRHAVRAHAAQKDMTIRRLLLTALREAGVPIPAGEIEDGHR